MSNNDLQMLTGGGDTLLLRRRMMMQRGGLPSSYQPVEYLQSHGTEYIDLGFKVHLRDDGAELKYQTEIGQMFYCGAMANSSQRFLLSNNGNRMSVGYSRVTHYTLDYYSPTKNCDDGLPHIFTYEKDGIFMMDGAKVKEGYPKTNAYTVYNMFLFTAAVDGNRYAMKLYYYQHKRNEALYANLVPCYRKADNVAGLYDLAGNICPLTGTPFFINAAESGEFTCGPDV